MTIVPTKVLKHQLNFCSDFTTRFLGLVAGFGAGKTKALALKTILLASRNVGTDGGVYSPTHTLAMDTFVPEFEDQLEELKIPYKYRATPLPSFTLKFPNGETRVLIRSFENWRRIRANNLSFACVDEIDVVEPKISRPALKLLMGRIRVGKVRQIAMVSTPEGFGLLYEFFVKEAVGKRDRRFIRASTYDNPFLAEDYIPSLLENYPPELIKAYLKGEFVNLTSGAVYSSFDRALNNCFESVQPGDRLHIGMDFNVGKMAAVVHVLRTGLPRAVDEFVGLADTPAMIAAIKARYPEHDRQRLITIYPDAAGNSRKTTNASESDIALLRQAAFTVTVDASNPAVKDRINAMNGAFCNAKGDRRYLVNTLRCPRYTEALEQQVWKDGEPDKSQGHDHLNDSAGYFIMKVLPVIHTQQFATSRSPRESTASKNTQTIRQTLGL
ncbi:phage terminase large subunit [Pantanalinema sp. GBBB05]|uniref:phage terminase large subunit n=1 Tax=Pantanalinema sp. GBBB05 TaxID=2604139 RepID=UPI001D2C7155|nr:terminase [Pantanalinema sp. GBBB05]